jgi:hypothetical protein
MIIKGAYTMGKFSGIKRRHVALSAFSVLVALLLVAAMGCGGGDDEDSGARTSVEVILTSVGITECFSCHADGLLAQYTENIFSAWLEGPHGNYESIDASHQHVDLGRDNTGFPYFGYHDLGTSADCTTECHDQLGDGLLLDDFYNETGIETLGIVDRPLVGCESCHGSGGDHFGVGALPYAVPGADRCGQCHNAEFDHQRYHPEGGDIYEDYLASPHGQSVNVLGEALCSRCHSDEGARAYVSVVDGTESASEMEAAMASMSDIQSPSSIQCRTCHDNHDPFGLLMSAGTDSVGNTVSAEYRTCTACHQILDDEGDRLVSYHNGFGAGYVITDTHYDAPDTPTRSGRGSVTSAEGIEGYVVDTSSDRACRDCHNPHDADITINEDWAHSSHGGRIAETINAVTLVADVTDTQGAGFTWVHYPWKDNGDPTDPTDDGRQECQHCHTSTGFKNLADNPTGYVNSSGLPSTLNEFAAVGEQAELLYCWACHSSNAGDLRDPGLFVNVNSGSYDAPADRIAAVPDIAGSNACMVCHSGRTSGQDVKDSTDDFTSKKFMSSHYLAAGGILFRTVGYEYDGLDYGNVNYFVHDRIGTSGVVETGENGPCVGCHMLTDEGHTFEAVHKDAAGDVTAITSFDEVCSNCHADSATLISDLNTLEVGFINALDALEGQLAARGVDYVGGRYKFEIAGDDWTATGIDATGKLVMGAAFNWVVLHYMDGAHVHNALYTRRLIYDAIDFLDDGTLNSSVEATLGAGDAYDFLAGTRL